MPRKTKETLIDKKKGGTSSNEVKLSMPKNKKKNSSIRKEKNQNLSKKSSSSTKKSTTKNKESKTISKSPAKINMEHLTQYYDLPYKYNKTVVKILAQTPKTLFVYWEISDEDKLKYQKEFGNDFFNITRPILIIHNITKNYSFEIEINDFANSWYFDVADEACEYSIEFGRRIVNTETRFRDDYIYIASSNEIESPNGHILFDKLSKTLYFKNVKNNETYSKDIANLQFMKRINKLYDIKEFYKTIYKKEDIFNINNPTSK